jgi:hypothetical protein
MRRRTVRCGCQSYGADTMAWLPEMRSGARSFAEISADGYDARKSAASIA